MTGRIHENTNAVAAAALAFCATLALCAGTALCEDGGKRSPSLEATGMAFENARLLPHDAGIEALREAAASAAEILETGLPGEKESAAWFLSAQIRFALGRYEEAAGDYERAGDKDREKIYRDDAAAGRIMAMEAAGRDGEAAKAWTKWLDRYDDSPIVPEAMLAFAWNALRRGDTAAAADRLDEMGSRYPWMAEDPRALLAHALLDYTGGDHAGALGILTDLEDSPEVVYLRALCRKAGGETLKAAAKFQEVAERWPHSSLRDPAMIAKADIFLHAGAYTSAAEEMEKVARSARREDIRREAFLRRAVAVYLEGDIELSLIHI